MRYLITGATGFIGGHVAEMCLSRGHTVHALVRPQSNTALLETLGVVLHSGSLNDVGFVREAVHDVDVVIHCAGKLGDWGPVAEFRKVNVECLRVLLEACKDQPLVRFLHMSSLAVYAARHHFGTTESALLPRSHRDGYAQSKLEAEELALRYYRDFGVPVVILRPGFVYGPRDQAVMPDLLRNLAEGKVRYPGGRGNRALNCTFIGNLLDAVLLASEKDQAVGQIYNITDGEFVSKRRFVEAVAQAARLPKPTRTPPYWLAWLITWCCDNFARWRGAKQAPLFNFTRFKFMAMNLDFSIDKARRELGYSPRFSFEEAIRETMQWYGEAANTRQKTRAVDKVLQTWKTNV